MSTKDITRVSPFVLEQRYPQHTIRYVATRPRRRDFLRVLRGKWQPTLEIYAAGTGTFFRNSDHCPMTRSSDE